jgi:hypothetical protein
VQQRLNASDPGLEIVNRDAAGIDVGNQSHYVAVPPGRDAQPVQYTPVDGSTTVRMPQLWDFPMIRTIIRSMARCSRNSPTLATSESRSFRSCKTTTNVGQSRTRPMLRSVTR